MVREAHWRFCATKQKRRKSDPRGVWTMHGATDASELQPKLSLRCPGSLQDAPWTFPGPSWSRPRALRTDPKQLFHAPKPFRSISGRCRMDLDRSKLPQHKFSSICRRIFVVFASLWEPFGPIFYRSGAMSCSIACPLFLLRWPNGLQR